jgi:hypothetical protein
MTETNLTKETPRSEAGSVPEREVSQSFKKPVIAAAVIFIALVLGAAGSWAVAAYLDRIYECGSGPGGICYSLINETDGQMQTSIKNLDPDKRYRLVVKQKNTDGEEIGRQVVMDMKKSADT